MCKGPEAGLCVICSKSNKEACVAVSEGKHNRDEAGEVMGQITQDLVSDGKKIFLVISRSEMAHGVQIHGLTNSIFSTPN